MEAAEALLLNRQKMVKLADRLELLVCTWSKNTRADELAKNSEDEKKITRAKKDAERVTLKRKKKRMDEQKLIMRSDSRRDQDSALFLDLDWVYVLCLRQSRAHSEILPQIGIRVWTCHDHLKVRHECTAQLRYVWFIHSMSCTHGGLCSVCCCMLNVKAERSSVMCHAVQAL